MLAVEPAVFDSREEWLAARRIGASDARVIAGAREGYDPSLYELWAGQDRHRAESRYSRL